MHVDIKFHQDILERTFLCSVLMITWIWCIYPCLFHTSCDYHTRWSLLRALCQWLLNQLRLKATIDLGWYIVYRPNAHYRDYLAWNTSWTPYLGCTCLSRPRKVQQKSNTPKVMDKSILIWWKVCQEKSCGNRRCWWRSFEGRCSGQNGSSWVIHQTCVVEWSIHPSLLSSVELNNF